MIAIKVDTIEQYELINSQIVELLGLNCRYCGRLNQPDINIVGGGYGIPYPDNKEQQDKLIDLNWIEVEILKIEEI